MLVEKVCPYVLRRAGVHQEILAFRHPVAGCQLIKGTLEPGEAVEAGALRELHEEAGLAGTVADGSRWSSAEVAESQIWHFVPVNVPPLPDHFDFFCADDGGHLFGFFWWPMAKQAGPDWHLMFVRALAEIRARHQ